MRLVDKNVIVTGAGSGIGRAASVRFAAEGAWVVAVDVNEAGARETADSIGGDTHVVVGSVSEPALWVAALNAAKDLGGLDAAYLNAGIYGFTGAIDEHPLDVYQATIDTNITGVVLGVRACVPELRSRGGGSLAVTASAAGIVAFDGNPIYTLTKHAVAGYVRAVAPRLMTDHITINAVCPGIVDTPMLEEALGGRLPTDSGVPFITPEQIADCVLDLLTSGETGVCRVVRERGAPVDWAFPTWADLADA